MTARHSVPSSLMVIMRLLPLFACLFCGTAFAQDSADSQISIARGEAVQITNIDDWLIGVNTATAVNFTLQYEWDATCVYTSTGLYSVEVSSGNGGPALFLESSGGDTMPYQLYFYYRRGATYTLSPGYTTPVTTLTNLSGSTSLTCADETFAPTNLWFTAVVRPGPFNAAPPGIYTDFATITVRPE